MARQRNIHTIAFDCDLRHFGLSGIVGYRPSAGVADLLRRDVEFSEHACRYGPNLAFALNDRRKVSTPSEILQSTVARQVLDEIDHAYSPDIMLFDMPPLMASDENFGFLQNVDAALIFAAAEQTTVARIDIAERQVAELTNVMGIVLNKCRYTTGAHVHDYGYY